ncbi:SpoIIE family protein phosphatase [Catellatospora sp. KI3]|uniref:PP2C family protein-serine/threonine phosphatase n=1 Tax=Catellatospora sp. KI3 TaxID=3041620 RepID=UPI0024821832|nr:SpoIIE family protein phosphatase [Catellatospora sp. KI3]MDI1463211.1 SpoIIE family protein phosphatase [Catellatospora sp. KI3]
MLDPAAPASGDDPCASRDSEQVAALPVIRELLAMLPGGHTWLMPVRAPDGQVCDFLTAATTESSVDIAGRGSRERIGSRLSQRYPGLVGGDLWQAYLRVLDTGQPWSQHGFVHQEQRGGVPQTSVFDVSVQPLRGGLLVSWHRVDEDRRRLDRTEALGNLGWVEYDMLTGVSTWSAGLYRIFGRDPADGPLAQAAQAALVLDEDRMVAAAAWHDLDDAGRTDIVVRMRIADRIRHLRVLAEITYDIARKPLKIYALVQDVTASAEASSALEKAGAELRRHQLSLLAEQRIAAQLQHIILPVPAEPFDLGGLRVLVQYQPAERRSHVGGDWYLALTSPTGTTVLGIGDVVGHGIAAANTMAQMRYALTAWVSIGITDPDRLIGNLNQLCLQLDTTGTALVAHIVETSVVWAHAGHPGPLHARAGSVTELAHPRGVMLGVLPEFSYSTAELTLMAGDLMLLYTDGLIEHPPADPDQRLADIKGILAGISAAGPDQPLSRLQEMLPGASPDDDTCVVGLRLR